MTTLVSTSSGTSSTSGVLVVEPFATKSLRYVQSTLEDKMKEFSKTFFESSKVYSNAAGYRK